MKVSKTTILSAVFAATLTALPAVPNNHCHEHDHDHAHAPHAH